MRRLVEHGRAGLQACAGRPRPALRTGRTGVRLIRPGGRIADLEVHPTTDVWPANAIVQSSIILPMPLTILGIPGSLRKASMNKALLRAAIELAPSDITIEVADLSGIPPYKQDEEMNPPSALVDLKTRVPAAYPRPLS